MNKKDLGATSRLGFTKYNIMCAHVYIYINTYYILFSYIIYKYIYTLYNKLADKKQQKKHRSEKNTSPSRSEAVHQYIMIQHMRWQLDFAWQSVTANSAERHSQSRVSSLFQARPWRCQAWHQRPPTLTL